MSNQGLLQKSNEPAYDQAKQDALNAEPPTTALDWLGIIGMMFLTYMTIILIWVIGMYGIEQNFVATVSCFMFIFFLIYIPLFSYMWYTGLQQRDALIKQFIQAKLQEQAVEIGAR